MNLLPMAVGLGMAISLLMTEAFGLATGGLVVPGYVALLVDRPYDLAVLCAATGVTYLAVQGIGSVAIVYGRRQTTITLLIGYLAHLGVRFAAQALLPSDVGEAVSAEHAIGLIVPGLLALWVARQGVLETAAALSCSAVATRLGLILLAGEGMSP